MAYGLYTTRFTITDRLSRVLGTMTLPTTAGSTTIAGFADGQGWAFEHITSLNPGGAGRTFSVSGTTLTWGAYVSTTDITYGIY